MGQLTVRNVDDGLVRELKKRAVQHGRSAEAEHRDILRRALAPERSGEAFKEFLLSLPDVGEDEDFARIRGSIRTPEL